MASVKEIIDLMDSPSKEDIVLIEKAYNFAEKVHEGKKRYSGETSFNHAFETAKILAEIRMGSTTIAAGLLHDTIRDGKIGDEQIKKEFGDEILFLVSGVTKIGKIKYGGTEKYIESLKKFLVTVSQDIRVLIIKFASRLQNMRTFEPISTDKQRKIALESSKIYSPLAYMLGIRKISKELEDLSFKKLYPKEYKETLDFIKEKSEKELPKLEKFVKSVKKILAEEGVINIRTSYRQKGIYSSYKKIKRIQNARGGVDKIYDILALRICVETVADCYKVLGIIHGTWQPLPGFIRDFIAFPKPNGYQSLHTTIFTGDGSIVEIQIRTNKMHEMAEFGVASYLFYKDDNKSIENNESTRWFKYFLPKFINYTKTDKEKEIPEWIKDATQKIDRDGDKKNKGTFLKDLGADVFSDRIFVFTPKGEVVDLPVGSSVLDFAYAIHSDIGNHTNSAKINGKMVAIKTVLKNGDIVEVITKKSSKPTTKWLEIVKTLMAKRHIKSFLEKGSDK